MKKLLAMMVTVVALALGMTGTAMAATTITSPNEGQIILNGRIDLVVEADWDTGESVQWAVRFETCEANTNTVAGNVDGFSTPHVVEDQTLSATLDVSGWDSGDYCVVVNPNSDARATLGFQVANGLTKDNCKQGAWEQYGFDDQGQCVSFFAAAEQADKTHP